MDDLGNRTGTVDLRSGTADYIFDTITNRYTAVASAIPNRSHDDAGNLATDHRGYSYSYDYENRLVQIYEDTNIDGDYDSGTDTNIAEFAYDALGRRIGKYDAVANTTTQYYYNTNWQVLAQYDVTGSETLDNNFIYGNYIDEVVIMTDGTDDYYFGHDHLFSPVALIEADGTIAERYEYDAYGKMTRFDPDFTAWSGTEAGNPYYFTGRRLDVLDGGDLNLMYYRNRTYDTETGRFLQTDPIGYYDSMNLYTYVGNNPTNYVDPKGTDRYIVSDMFGLHRSIAVDQYKTTSDGEIVVSHQLSYSIESKNWWYALWKSEGEWQDNQTVANDNPWWARDRILRRVKSTYKEDQALQREIRMTIDNDSEPIYGILGMIDKNSTATWCVPFSYGLLYEGMSWPSQMKSNLLQLLKGEFSILNLFIDEVTPEGTVVGQKKKCK